ncbi:MAG: hypothetical protein JXX28_20065 [Deltaproteobacteria bacterium]|nr:hypothetical protein [Deltaproteobacteria bacterium]
MSTLHVHDGTAQLYRQFFGGTPFTSPEGTEVGAVLGVCQALTRSVREHLPPLVAVVFDTGKPSFRSALYPDYKGNRALPPDALLPQFDLTRQAVAALGLPIFAVDGFEADDLMATLTARARRRGHQVVLHANDKDILQLVGPGVSVEDPRTHERLDDAGVIAKMGVRPDQIVDFLALTGDAVDNLPGVKGVGAKSAQALLAEFDHLEDLYGGLERVLYLKVRGARALQNKLAEGKEQAYLTRELVLLRRDAPIPGLSAESDLRPTFPGPDADALFDRLGFHRPLRAMRGLFG